MKIKGEEFRPYFLLLSIDLILHYGQGTKSIIFDSYAFHFLSPFTDYNIFSIISGALHSVSVDAGLSTFKKVLPYFLKWKRSSNLCLQKKMMEK